jgi:beta-galactosidase/beta-glucuronidase
MDLADLLAGVQTTYALYSWFSTSFTVPSSWAGKSVLLNFGAVDYEATVFINGQKAGFNRGGYSAFTIDATKFVNIGGNNEM